MNKPSETTWKNGALWPVNAFRCGGGGKGSAQPVVQQLNAAPTPAAAPPVTAAAAEVVQAQQDARRQALKRRGFAKTIFAGDQSGFFPSNTNPSPANPKAPRSSGSPGNTTLGGS